MKRYILSGLLTVLASTSAYAGDQTKDIERQANKGDVTAQITLAETYAAAGDHPRAEEWYEKAGASGDARALEILCIAYMDGANWTQANHAKASSACQVSEALGSLEARRRLAHLYGKGLGGLEKNGNKAVSLLQQVFDKTQSAPDLLALALSVYEGDYVSPQYERSFTLFKAALRLGSDEAIYYLAAHYEAGLGTPAEPAEAHRLYFYAGLRGNIAAQAWLQNHPEVTEASVAENQISTDQLPSKYLSKQRYFDGTFVPIPVQLSLAPRRIGEYYPPRAKADEVAGHVQINCHISLAGNFDNCLAISEKPAGYGFANAAERMIARTFKTADFTDKEEWTRLYAGKSYSFPITFLPHDG